MKKALIISVGILYACSSALAQVQKIERPAIIKKRDAASSATRFARRKRS